MPRQTRRIPDEVLGGTWFHGSLVESIERFNPCCHFGTRNAAVDAVARKLFYDDWEHGIAIEAATPVLYSVRLNVTATQAIAGGDPGARAGRGVLVKLRHEWTDTFDGVTIFDFLHQHSGKPATCNATEAMANEFCQAVFRAKGLSCYAYLNEVEGAWPCAGDNLEWSICMVDPGCIVVERSEPLQLSELIAAIDRGPRLRTTQFERRYEQAKAIVRAYSVDR